MLPCNHSAGEFNVPRWRGRKPSLTANTGAIDGWCKCAKDSIPPSVRSLLGNPEANAKFVCVQQYAWHWERAGTDLMAVAGQNAHKPISSA